MIFFSFWSNLIQSGLQRIMKKALFSPVFFKFSNYHLFDNLESGKINECFGKKSGKKY